MSEENNLAAVELDRFGGKKGDETRADSTHLEEGKRRRATRPRRGGRRNDGSKSLRSSHPIQALGE
jgi:hypothetical protein